MVLLSASTDMGIFCISFCLGTYESLPPSDECASSTAFTLINHGRFVLFCF